MSLSQNPLLSQRQLDSDYYVTWAREIGAGDLLSRDGLVGGAPFILNPLYAYVLAPVVRLSEDPALPVIVFQALLAGATTALAALAARRLFGRAAAWTAGFAIAFSTALVQLDLHIAVSGLAAFLTAGAVYASAPSRDGASGRGHGPVAAGLWLGLGALARPITPIALPFFAGRYLADGGPRRFGRAALVALVFASCVLPSLLRNWAVSGEPVLFTTSSGLNLRLGNNPEARRFRGMVSAEVRFNPIEMHEDARRFVVSAQGGDPTPSEVSSYFTRMTVDEFVRHPGASAAHYAHKLRWFLSPLEVPSTASLANDLRFVPLLRIAFVPTWLVACAGIAGIFLHRRRREVLCGPGALVFAYAVVLTLVFPLSHYRSPAIPALAVLAGGTVQWTLAAWSAGARGRAAAAGASIFILAVIGWLPPQPDPMRHADAMLLTRHHLVRQDWEAAERSVESAIAEYRAQDISDADAAPAFFLQGELSARQEKWDEALARLTFALGLQPGNWPGRLMRSRVAQFAGRQELAESDARSVVDELPPLPEGHGRLGEVLWWLRRYDEARPHLQYARARSAYVDPDVLREAGIR